MSLRLGHGAQDAPADALGPRPTYRLIVARHIAWGWSLDQDATAHLLGVPVSASFRDGVSLAQSARIERVIHIAHAIDQLRPDWDEADAWVHEPHAALAGRTPRDVMLSEADGLARVHRLLSKLLAGTERSDDEPA